MPLALGLSCPDTALPATAARCRNGPWRGGVVFRDVPYETVARASRRLHPMGDGCRGGLAGCTRHRLTRGLRWGLLGSKLPFCFRHGHPVSPSVVWVGSSAPQKPAPGNASSGRVSWDEEKPACPEGGPGDQGWGVTHDRFCAGSSVVPAPPPHLKEQVAPPSMSGCLVEPGSGVGG